MNFQNILLATKHSGKLFSKNTEIQTERNTDRQTDIQTERNTDRHTERQTDTQTDDIGAVSPVFVIFTPMVVCGC